MKKWNDKSPEGAVKTSLQALSDRTFALAADEDFLDRLSAHFFEIYSDPVVRADFSDILVLTPALSIGTAFRSALIHVMPAPFLLPRFDTLKNWASRSSFHEIPDPLPASERLVLLYETLCAKDYFNEHARWGVAAEISSLFEELNECSIRLPEEESAFTRQLEKAYALKAYSPLEFEARLIHTLWSAMNASGMLDATALYPMRLAKIAQSAGKTPQPLFVLLDAAPEEALNPAEQEFLRRYDTFWPVSVVYPAPREKRMTPLMRLLDAAWPQTLAVPLKERASALARELPQSPLAERLRFIQANGRESEARIAVTQTRLWLNEGLRKIALIAQDRLTARRVRAALERQNILVRDETGWKLSTSRAAATVDALLETVAGRAYYRDVLDLCKSPYIFSDIPPQERQTAIFALETAIRQASLTGELYRIRRCVLKASVCHASSARVLVDRIAEAAALLSGRKTRLSEWIGRLQKALEILGALPPLSGDVAGKTLLKLLEDRQSELGVNETLFPFDAWRAWLNREMESVNFRDDRIESPITLTPLNAVCLRRFDAALLLGGSEPYLSPDPHSRFFSQSVRRELSLKTHEHEAQKLRRDLALFLATVPRVVVTWQSQQDGESCPLAPELALLSDLHRLGWNDDLHALSPPYTPDPEPETDTAPGRIFQAAPAIFPALIPRRISVGAYATLVGCPYRFFARHALRLGEMEEVREEMKKREYGEFIHRILEMFHLRHPLISSLDRKEALAALKVCANEVFDPEILDDFQAIAWKIRWEKHLEVYLDWQCAQEAQGWRWRSPEVSVSYRMALDHGESLELHGRIDRIDDRVSQKNGGMEVALFDYKTQKETHIKSTLNDDVQLPMYAFMYKNSGQAPLEFPVKAAYVALDDEKILILESGDDSFPLQARAEAQEQRLRQIFSALYGGAHMPAQGASRLCAFCEMNGLCRKDHV